MNTDEDRRRMDREMVLRAQIRSIDGELASLREKRQRLVRDLESLTGRDQIIYTHTGPTKVMTWPTTWG